MDQRLARIGGKAELLAAAQTVSGAEAALAADPPGRSFAKQLEPRPKPRASVLQDRVQAVDDSAHGSSVLIAYSRTGTHSSTKDPDRNRGPVAG